MTSLTAICGTDCRPCPQYSCPTLDRPLEYIDAPEARPALEPPRKDQRS